MLAESVQTTATYLISDQVRKIERGALIVMAVMEDCKVILQMPRGNLETIHPRALVLYVVWQHLNKYTLSVVSSSPLTLFGVTDCGV